MKMLYASNTEIGFSEMAAKAWTHRCSISTDRGMTSLLPQRTNTSQVTGILKRNSWRWDLAKPLPEGKVKEYLWTLGDAENSGSRSICLYEFY